MIKSIGTVYIPYFCHFKELIKVSGLQWWSNSPIKVCQIAVVCCVT